MKRLILFSIITLTLITLVMSGDRLIARILNEKLAALLTEQLGLPVTLAPMQVQVFSLSVTAPKLILGAVDNPAIVASDVMVSLAWPDLLDRKIRLLHVSAGDVTVNISRWPDSDSPSSTDYTFLDPWLPQTLQVATARYIAASGEDYPLKKLRWRRGVDGVTRLDWSEDRSSGEVTVGAELNSLQQLFKLAAITVDINIDVTGTDNAKISLHSKFQPGKTSGYQFIADVETGAGKAHIVASNDVSWRLPAQSKTSIEKIELRQLASLIDNYTESEHSSAAESLLSSALPNLNLPNHHGSVSIVELRLDDEVVKDNVVDFTSSAQGLAVTSLTSQGPTGILQGNFAISNSAKGWQVQFSADMQARNANNSIAAEYLNADWLWREGHLQLDGSGATWGALLNSMRGGINLAGVHRGKVDTPIHIAAQLDNRAEEFTIDQLAIQLGDGRISGSMAFMGLQQRKFVINIKGEKLHLDFLFANQQQTNLPGIAIPNAELLPDIELDWQLQLQDLQMPGLSLAQANINLTRKPEQATLHARVVAAAGGKLDMQLTASTPVGRAAEVSLAVKLHDLDFLRIFKQSQSQPQPLLHSRTTGTLNVNGQGHGWNEILKAMHGNANLTVAVKSDNDWQRLATAKEQLTFVGNAGLVIDSRRIIGVNINDIKIASFDQDLTGKLTLVAGRSPWLVADFKSHKLNIEDLLALQPPVTDKSSGKDLLSALKDMEAMKLSLEVDALQIMNTPLKNMTLQLSSVANKLSIDKLAFNSADSRLQSNAEITWHRQMASLQAHVKVENIDLDRFLIANSFASHIPVSGTIDISGKGAQLSQLWRNLSGQIDLHSNSSSAVAPLKNRRKLNIKLKRLPDGASAQINSLQWGENKLSGSVRYRHSVPALWEVDIQKASLSLLAWEQQMAKIQSEKESTAAVSVQTSGMASVASSSANLVSNVLLAPIKFFSAPSEAKPGDKYFSDKPLLFTALKASNANIKAQIDSVVSNQGLLKDLTLSALLNDGQFVVQANADYVNKGKADIYLSLDANKMPATVAMTASINKVYGNLGQDSYPSSSFVTLTGQGQSPAQLAASLNGMVYFETGKGPLSATRLTLLNAELASSMLNTLIPGMNKKPSELECGATLLAFKNGKAKTPYGFAARTTQANLVGRIAVDLNKEMLLMKFDSSNRQGVGISIGSVFSNTVEIKGPLTNPKIVPNKTAIAWRGLAAFMTAGASVMTESIYKRTLSSNNPCKSVIKNIRKDLCVSNQAAATSSLICPQG